MSYIIYKIYSIKRLPPLLYHHFFHSHPFQKVNSESFHGFIKAENLSKHEENCIRFKAQGIKFPSDDKLFFKSFGKTVQSPAYIVAGNNCL